MKIFILQKRCIRLITFSEFQEHTKPVFKSFKMLKLQEVNLFVLQELITIKNQRYFYYK